MPIGYERTTSTKTAGASSTRYLTYTIAAGDFDQEGTYSFNAYLDVKGVGE